VVPLSQYYKPDARNDPVQDPDTGDICQHCNGAAQGVLKLIADVCILFTHLVQAGYQTGHDQHQ